MGGRDTARRQPSTTLSCFAALLLASVLLLLLFSSSPSLRSSVAPQDHHTAAVSCNYSDGAWIRDRGPFTPRYDHTCKEIFKGWNCISSGKFNGWDLLQWHWQPYGCDLSPLEPIRFLHRYKNTNIGFVGDSLNRNMFVSLVCMLRRASGDVKKLRPAGADRGFTFLRYNLTIAYHRTNLLVRYGSWSASEDGGALESLGYKQGYRVDVDLPEHTWAEAPAFHHILIFNTGHWWYAPSKFDPIQSPMLFFEKGMPLLPPLPPDLGMDIALKHMISYVEKRAGFNAIKFFRTQSPRHFEGGDWNGGGSCRRTQPLLPKQVEDLFSSENGTNTEARSVNRHLQVALQGSSFRILEVSRMSEFRADAHPSTMGGKRHEDCMHWCLPGLTDWWNDVLSANLDGIQRIWS